MGTMLSLIATLALTLSASNATSVDGANQFSRQEVVDQLGRSSTNRTIQHLNDTMALPTGFYYVIDSGSGVPRELDRTTETYWLNPTPIVTAKDISKFDLYEAKFDGESSWGLSMQLDSEGTAAWSIATSRWIGRQLALIVNNELLEVPKVMAEIPSGMTALNRGIYSKKELEEIRKAIESDHKR